MKNKLIYSLFAFCLLISLVSATVETEIYKLNTPTTLRFTCTTGGVLPTAAAVFNITVNYPNGTAFLNNVKTTALGNGLFTYNTTFPILGLYSVQMVCVDGLNGYSNTGIYNITPTGFVVDTSKSIIIFIGLGIMLLIGVLLFIFALNNQMPIIKLFSFGLSILMIAFAFGYSINILNAGIGEFSGLTDTFGGVYRLITILLIVGGIGLILWLITFALKSFSKTRGFQD